MAGIIKEHDARQFGRITIPQTGVYSINIKYRESINILINGRTVGTAMVAGSWRNDFYDSNYFFSMAAGDILTIDPVTSLIQLAIHRIDSQERITNYLNFGPTTEKPKITLETIDLGVIEDV